MRRRLPRAVCTTTSEYVFDLKPETDVFWCTADAGWVTGHSLLGLRAADERGDQRDVKGPPDYPQPAAIWGALERYRVSVFYTAPTIIQSFIELGRRSGRIRPVLAAPARHRGRADQPQGVALVSNGDRRRSLSDRRHLVANRDRGDAGRAVARRGGDQARRGGAPASRHPARGVRRRWRSGAGGAGCARAEAPLALDASHPVQGGRRYRQTYSATSTTAAISGVRRDRLLRGRRRPGGRRGPASGSRAGSTT